MIVYLLVNQVNGKSYVGQTRHSTLAGRWRPSLSSNSANSHLRAAISKYGPKSFTRAVLAHASCQEELDLLEKFFITVFQTCNPLHGYNQQTGGLIGAGRHSHETIRRISDGNKRHWRKKSRETMVVYSENARLRWDMWPEERKRKWAEDCRARWWNRTPEDRNRIIELVRKNTRGLKRSAPGWNKGLLGWNAGEQKSQETRKRLSVAIKGYWERKRAEEEAHLKQPANAQEMGKRAIVALREVEEAKRTLGEIKQRLDALKFELKGGCVW